MHALFCASFGIWRCFLAVFILRLLVITTIFLAFIIPWVFCTVRVGFFLRYLWFYRFKYGFRMPHGFCQLYTIMKKIQKCSFFISWVFSMVGVRLFPRYLWFYRFVSKMVFECTFGQFYKNLNKIQNFTWMFLYIFRVNGFVPSVPHLRAHKTLMCV